MYKTLYDVGTASPINWPILLGGIGFVVALTAHLLISVKRRLPVRQRRLPAALVGFGVLWTLLGVGLPYYYKVTRATALHDGQTYVVEGVVQNFHSRSDCKNESFTVSGHTFEYSYYEDMARFHYPEPCGGPIKAGMNLRITYVGEDDIIKVEQRLTKER